MMKKYIADFHTSFYVPAVQNIAFHLPHVFILCTSHCGNTRFEVFKHRSAKQDMLCPRGYSERVLSILEHQIQSE